LIYRIAEVDFEVPKNMLKNFFEFFGKFARFLFLGGIFAYNGMVQIDLKSQISFMI